MTEATVTNPWESMGYVPVGHIRHKLIGRWLRTQRKTMLRFFMERGFFELAERVRQLRDDSRLDRMTKNHQFQRILDDYSKLITPKPAVSTERIHGAPTLADSEALHPQAEGITEVGVSPQTD
jgi:hypothetical protein